MDISWAKMQLITVKRRRLVTTVVALLGVTSLLLFLHHVWNPGFQPQTIFPLQRDLLEQEDWPERQINETDLQRPILTVHYLWCGAGRQFRFQDYLSVLSVVRVLRPLKVLFHYETLPQPDPWYYNSWFLELKAGLPGLELQRTDCASSEFVTNAQQLLTSEGGVVIGSDVILTRFPAFFPKNPLVVFLPQSPTSSSQGVLFAARGHHALRGSLDAWTRTASGGCVSVDAYNSNNNNNKPDDHDDVSGGEVGPAAYCVDVANRRDIFPHTIHASDQPFGELARWIFYGKRQKQVPQSDPSQPIPRWSHYVMLTGDRNWTLTFSQYVGVLSALHVAGFTHVFMHVERAPGGPWWAELAAANENVTVVLIDRPRSVYQTNVNVIQHVSDVVRAQILFKYGGAYQDWDVVWANRVPDWLLAYPAVMGHEAEWSKDVTGWPGIFNNGIMLARPAAPWLRHFLLSMQDFRDDDWAYNSLRMSYKTFEHYPDTVYADPYLQVMCGNTECHPAWGPVYDTQYHPAGAPFKMRDQTRAFHLTAPKPYPPFADLHALRAATGVFADLGRFVLVQSGKGSLLT